MADRINIFNEFVLKWTHPEYRPKPLANTQLAEVENSLGIFFPLEYIDYMIEFGHGGTSIDLLDSIVEGQLDTNDLSDMLSAESIIETTNSWRDIGLPNTFVAFASDSRGNLFCFNQADCAQNQEHSPVWFFDHDDIVVEKLSDSFTGWISDLVLIKNINA